MLDMAGLCLKATAPAISLSWSKPGEVVIDSNSLLFSGRITLAIERFVQAYSLPIIGVTGIITLFFVVSLHGLRVENSPDQLSLPEDDPCRVELRQFEAQFQTGKTIIIGMESEHPLAGRELNVVLALTQSLARIEEVTGVQSLSTAFRLHWKWSAGMYELRPRLWFPASVRNKDSAAATAIHDITSHPLYQGNLISSDGHHTAIILAVETRDSMGVKSVPRLREILDRIRDQVEPYESETLRFHFAGTPLIAIGLHDALRGDLLLFAPLSILLLLLTFAVVLRSILPIIVGCVVAATALIWTLGFLAVTGTPMSLNLAIIVPLIPSLALVYAMHYLTAVMYRPCALQDGKQGSVGAVSHVYVPSWLCGVTTMVGFFSLSVSPLRGIREVGIYLAFGVAACLWIVNILLPALLCRLHLNSAATNANRQIAVAAVQALHRATSRRPRVVLIIGCLAVVALGAGALTLRIETNHLEYFDADNPLRKDFTFIDQHFGGVLPIEVVTSIPREQSADAIASIAAFTGDLHTLTGMGAVVSVADLLTEADRMKPDPGAYYSPDIDLKKGKISRDVWRPITESRVGRAYVWISDSLIVCRVGCRAHIATSSDLDRLLKEVEHLARTHLGKYSPVVTGITKNFVRTEDYVVSTQIRSFAIALAVTMIMIGLLAGSWRVGAAAIAVNICPVVGVLGVMGWLRIPLDIATVMIASIAIGIVVDDTIHILYNYRQGLASGNTAAESLAKAFVAVGVPITVSTVTLCIGFFVLALAHFNPTACFGGLSALTIFMAAVADLVILPVVLARPFVAGSPSGPTNTYVSESG